MPKLDKAARAAAKRDQREKTRADRQAERQRERDAKLAKAVRELEQIGEDIAARLVSISKAQAVIVEKAKAQVEAVINHADSIEAQLATAKGKCKDAGWTFEQFREKYAPDYSRAKVYQLCAIGKGVLSIEDKRAADRDRQRKSRENRKAKPSVTVTDNQAPHITAPDGPRINVNELGPKAQEQLRAAGPQEISIEQRQAEMAQLAGEEPPTTAAPVAPEEPGIPEPEPQPETDEERSDRLLAEFKNGPWTDQLRGLTLKDIDQAKNFFLLTLERIKKNHPSFKAAATTALGKLGKAA